MEDYRVEADKDSALNDTLIALCEAEDRNGEFEGMKNHELVDCIVIWLEDLGIDDVDEGEKTAFTAYLREYHNREMNILFLANWFGGFKAGVDYCSRVEGRV